MNEQWIDVKDRLPEIGQRVRALVVKEMIYMGNSDWKYDAEGEHGIYSWCEKLNVSKKMQNSHDVWPGLMY